MKAEFILEPVTIAGSASIYVDEKDDMVHIVVGDLDLIIEPTICGRIAGCINRACDFTSGLSPVYEPSTGFYVIDTNGEVSQFIATRVSVGALNLDRSAFTVLITATVGRDGHTIVARSKLTRDAIDVILNQLTAHQQPAV